MRIATTLAAAPAAVALATAPAAAAGDYPFLSLYNTDLVVAIAFVLFLGVLGYFRVHEILGGMLDKRAEGIRNDLDEARKLCEEAQQVLSAIERKAREMEDKAARVVEKAKRDADDAARLAADEIEAQVARRLAAAEAQIASVEAEAIRSIRNRAASVAIAAAGDILAGSLSARDANRLIDEGIETVARRLN